MACWHRWGVRLWVAAGLALLWSCGLWAAPSNPPTGPVPAGSWVAGPVRFQFAIYYPVLPAKAPDAAMRARLAAMAQGPQLIDQPVRDPKHPVLGIDWVTDAQQSYRPPSVELTQRFGRGLTKAQAQALAAAPAVLILNFAHPADQALPALRRALLLTEQVARDTQGLPWDDETREVFTPDAWQQNRLNTWDGDWPDVARHTVIHAYKGDAQIRAISLGMLKFGLPDVVVDDFSWSMSNPMGNLLNGLAQLMVEGRVATQPGRFDLRLDAIAHAAARKAMTSDLKGQAKGQAVLPLRWGRWETGDPENRLLQIGFDGVPGPDLPARQEALLTSVFGSEDDSVKLVRHDDELRAASQAARAQLPALRDGFAKGWAPGQYLMVKVPFATASKGREWMWVEVITWAGDHIGGLLRNEPRDVPGLHAGQEVNVSMADVFDYLVRFPDGRTEGNRTGAIIQKAQAGSR